MSLKQIPLDIRNLVIRDRQNGDSFRIIVNKYAISVGAVQHIWKKYKKHGIVTNYSGKGRKRTTIQHTTSRDDTRIVQMVK